jgi:DNA-binding NarL/FixJ family response regulator
VSKGGKMRVLIADDQPHVRSALLLLLRQEPDVTVVGEAGDAEQALELVAGQQPDLVLLDWELPGRGGTATLARLQAARPGLLVIALSGRPESRRAALAAGVDVFVSKGEPPDQLLAAVEGCRQVVVRRLQ